MMQAIAGSTGIGLADMAGRLGLALLLGGLVGLDRELRHKDMGVRTTMLVALGTAAFAVIATELGRTIATTPGFAEIELARIIEGIVGGIGFLGAGAIIKGDGRVQGATTGAAIWAVGGIGLACGFALHALAIMTTALVLLVLAGLGLAKRWLRGGQGDG